MYIEILVGLFTLFFLYLIYTLFWSTNKSYWNKKGVTYISSSQIAPFWKRFSFSLSLCDVDKKIYSLSSEPYVGLDDINNKMLFIRDPELIKQVLVKDFDHFVDRRYFDMSKSDPYMCKALTVVSGQEWKLIRNKLTPTFTTGKIRRMFDVFQGVSDKLVEHLNDKIAEDDGQVNFSKIFGGYTADVIAQSAFGFNGNCISDPNSIFIRMSQKLQTFNLSFLLKIIFVIVLPKIAKILGLQLLDKEATEFFKGLIRTAIKNRENLPDSEKPNDFLQLLLEARDGKLKTESTAELESFEKDAQLKSSELAQSENFVFTEQIIIAQSILFFLAGFDTTESLLLFVAYELAKNPQCQEKLRREIDRSFEQSEKGKLDYDGINKMEYLDMFISETLRKYPPGQRLERSCTQDYTFPGTGLTLEKGVLVGISPHALHNDVEIYPNPDQFDPERFTEENKASRHPYAYLPFGHGPRNCIGMRFALIEAKIAVAKLVRNFVIEPCEKTPNPMKFHLKKPVLKPEKDIWVKLKSRKMSLKVE